MRKLKNSIKRVWRRKTNFFEKRVGEYSLTGVGVENENMEFNLNAEF